MVLIIVILTQIYALWIIPPVKWFESSGKDLGITQKIFYIHVPSAWMSFLGIFLSAFFGLYYIYRRNPKYDKLSASFMEVSVLFLSIALITGSLWAKPAWGTFWTWDPRLVSMAILWMLGLGYLFFRSLVEEEELRKRFSAMLSIITAVNVPIVIFSIRLFRTLHPGVIKGLSSSHSYGMDTPVLMGLIMNIISVGILFVFLSIERYKKK